MNLNFKHNCLDIDWKDVLNILDTVNMKRLESEVHKKAFENSYSVVFAFDEDKLIGFARAISDGVYESGIYDVAVLPQYQGKGIGKMIVQKLVESIPGSNFILYAGVGKEGFYESMNFRKMKTGMALFSNAKRMQERGLTE